MSWRLLAQRVPQLVHGLYKRLRLRARVPLIERRECLLSR